ncbi:MAG: choice-of-anchor tandem repeat GloVer-containing protein [Candidatus Korobacteraceae bacterium]
MMRSNRGWEIRIALLATMAGLFILLGSIAAPAQTLTVLHEFTGGADGSNPYSSLAMDRGGNLYGVVPFGGSQGCETQNGIGCGTVYKLAHRGTGWAFSTLYEFTQGAGGSIPVGTPFIASDGTIYGTTDGGGNLSCRDTFGDGCGTIYHLRPQPNFCASFSCPWNNTVLYTFTGAFDGNDPLAGVVLDAAGNVYGTTYQGGDAAGGVYELSPSGSGWVLDAIHTFAGGTDGAFPFSGVILDSSGNLDGTTLYGGSAGNCLDGGCGTVYQLVLQNTRWVENILYNFPADQNGPLGGVIFDPSGNLYGTYASNSNGVYELAPLGSDWIFTTLYAQDFGRQSYHSSLARDAGGNLYGVSEYGGNFNCNNGCGVVYKLSPSDGGWTYSQVYAFTGGSDGAYPYGGVVLDSSGNIYGTTSVGGTHTCGSQGCGVVWEVSQ